MAVVKPHKLKAFLASAMIVLPLVLASCVPSAAPKVSVETPIYYMPRQEGHKTIYGHLIYSGIETPRDGKKNGPFAPWNIKATEICFEAISHSGKSDEKCQKLQRYNREGLPPENFDSEALYKETFFAIFVDSHTESLRLKSIRLYGKDYAYAVKFLSPPSGRMPETDTEMLHTDFIDFGNIAVETKIVAGKEDPEINIWGTISYPFKDGIKARGGGCAALLYDIPYVLERIQVSGTSP